MCFQSCVLCAGDLVPRIHGAASSSFDHWSIRITVACRSIAVRMPTFDLRQRYHVRWLVVAASLGASDRDHGPAEGHKGITSRGPCYEPSRRAHPAEGPPPRRLLSDCPLHGGSNQRFVGGPEQYPDRDHADVGSPSEDRSAGAAGDLARTASEVAVVSLEKFCEASAFRLRCATTGFSDKRDRAHFGRLHR